MTSDAFMGSDTFPAGGVDIFSGNMQDLDLTDPNQKRAFETLSNFNNMEKGSSVRVFKTLKLINDTMNDGQT